MRVVLTQRQYAVLLKRARPPLDELLQRDTRMASKARMQVTMPAAAWRELCDQIQPAAFGPRGGRAKEFPLAALNAFHLINDALSRYELHPAFRSAAMPGVHIDILPAWVELEMGLDRPWSPYPNGRRMYILWPQRTSAGGMTVTIWVAVPAERCRTRNWLLGEDAHHHFVRHDGGLPIGG